MNNQKKTAPSELPAIRDRVLRLERVRGRDLAPNPKNWRQHPQAQRDAMKVVLAEVGFAGAALARETDAGLALIDGHLRAELAPDQEIPVLVLDVTAEEGDKLLASFDVLTGMAEEDKRKRLALLRELRELGGGGLEFKELLASWDDGIEDITPPEVAGEDFETDDGEAEDGLDLLFKAPFVWFGGKARVARAVWKRFGDVPSYIEPFFGSGAVFLNRPQPFTGTETVNDADGFVANFWRALQSDPDAVAHYADWPVNENDLHARHAWLVGQKDTLQARLEGDPEFCDARVAGWWVWGMACWIGGEFCSGKGPWQVQQAADGTRHLVRLDGPGPGVNHTKPHLSSTGQGISRRLVHLGGGRGVGRKLDGQGAPGQAGLGERGLLAWMRALAERFRLTRVCCGDWSRVCGGKDGEALNHMIAPGTCAVFLDPPYADTAGRADKIYSVDSLAVAHAVREWAIAHGNDPRFRIALCGYEGEHRMPSNWAVVKWQAAGGYSSVASGDSVAKANKFRERIWFSPYCLVPEKAPRPVDRD
jgi:hypothetical protein